MNIREQLDHMVEHGAETLEITAEAWEALGRDPLAQEFITYPNPKDKTDMRPLYRKRRLVILCGKFEARGTISIISHMRAVDGMAARNKELSDERDRLRAEMDAFREEKEEAEAWENGSAQEAFFRSLFAGTRG
ncbi:MAG: hypothetical protein KKE73_10840 [Proteobacteria bacterium]|nr:hypothetical protein [Pseudomonadota bacterium]